MVVVALSTASMLVILPVACLVYMLMATLLAMIPREDLATIYVAIAHRTRRVSPSLSTPVTSRQVGHASALALSGSGYSSGSSSVEWRVEHGGVQLVDTTRLLRWLQNVVSSVTTWVRDLMRRIRSGISGVTTQARRTGAATLRYATNYLISYVPSYPLRYLWYRRVLGWDIGQDAVVMAGAVVTHNVEPFTVVGGVPAKLVSERILRDPSYHLIERPLFE